MKTEHYHKLLTEKSSAERRAPGDPSIILNSICSHFRREIRLFALTSRGRSVSLFSLLREDGFLCYGVFCFVFCFAVSSAPVLGDRPEAEQVETSLGVAMGAVSEMRSETRAGTDWRR